MSISDGELALNDPATIQRTLWLHFGEILPLKIRVARHQNLTDHTGNRGSGYRLDQGRPVFLGLNNCVEKNYGKKFEAHPVDMLISDSTVRKLLFDVNVVIGIVSLFSVSALILGAQQESQEEDQGRRCDSANGDDYPWDVVTKTEI